MRLPYKRSGLRTYLIFLSIIAYSYTPFWILIGIPLFTVGIAIRLWAKGHLNQNREITMSGPYRFVRHPFYLGSFILDIGISIMSGFIPLMILTPFLWLSIYIPKMRKEESHMIKLFGNLYRSYKDRVPMLIPYRMPLPKGAKFSWKSPNILRTEIPRIFRFLCYPFIFFILYLIKEYGISIFHSSKALIPCACIVSFYIISWEIKNHFAYSKNILPFSLSISMRLIILISIIALGFLIHWAELEYDHIIWPLGIGLISSSFLFKDSIKSEWIMATGFSVLFELLWLALILSPFYLALFLDNRLPDAGNKENLKLIILIILTIGLILALSKELYYF